MIATTPQLRKPMAALAALLMMLATPGARAADPAGEAVAIPSLALDLSSYPRARVLRVIDGDTVELHLRGQAVSCRLIGVDAPEVRPRNNQPAQPYAAQSSEFLHNLLAGEEVFVRVGPSPTDNFGRTLAYLYRAPDGLFVNPELVRQGYATVYRRIPFPEMPSWLQHERRAKEAGKGLWNPRVANPRPEPLPEGRGPLGRRVVPTPEPTPGAPLTPVTPGPSDPLALPGMVAPGAASSALPITGSPPAYDPGQATVYITNSGRRFHNYSCRTLGEDGGRSITRADAERAGYTPCGICRP